MTLANVVDLEARPRVFASLRSATRQHGPEQTSVKLAELQAFLESDLAGIERDLATIDLGATSTAKSAAHLLSLGGKRLRPMCVALASRVGSGFSEQARDLAVSAELVHSATLLHDDVVDVGERRRGAVTARLVYGNAASIFAGDWVLVEALIRVKRAGYLDVLDRALGVLAEMLEAEALQLDRRGKLDGTLADYLRVVRGKTASLFRWSLYAGARAGGLSDAACLRLEQFGEALGLAFQVTDDLLDLNGDPNLTGKELFGDLREGKLTYPLLWAFDQKPALRERLAAALSSGAEIDDATSQHVCEELRALGAVEETHRYAEELITTALQCLAELEKDPEVGDTPALRALATVAHAVTARRK